jgi:hypothetical protein
MRRRAMPIAAISMVCLCAATSAASGAPGWLPAQELSEVGHPAQYTSAAIGADGGASVAWVRSDGSNERVQVALRAPFGVFQAPLTVSSEKQNAAFPQVAQDGAGETTVVWWNQTGGSIVEAATIAGGHVSPPVSLSEIKAAASFPTVAVNDRGDTVVAWIQDDGGSETATAVFRAAGGPFGVPVSLSASGQDAEFPRVAIDAAGDATVVWTRGNGTNKIVEAAYRPAAGSFGAAMSLSASGESAKNPFVAMDDAGDTAVSWQREESGNEIAQVAVRPTGAAFGAPTSLSAPGANAANPEVALDGQGEPTVVWTRNNILQVAAGTRSGVFSQPQSLADSAVYPSIAEDPAGAAVVGYRDPITHQAAAAYRSAGGAFGGPLGISPAEQTLVAGGPGEETQMSVAIDDGGDALFGYTASDGTSQRTAAALLDGAAPGLGGLSIPTTAIAGAPVAFSVSPLDQISSVTATTWSFGDASSASGSTVTHTFARPGTYAVTVTATDAFGNATTQTASILVGEGAIPPPVAAFHPASLALTTATSDGHGRVRLTIACPAGGATCAGTVSLTLTATATGLAVAARAKPKGLAVTVPAGHASFSVAPGARDSVTVKLATAVAKLLAKRHSLKLSAAVESVAAAGQITSKSSTLLVKAPKPKKGKKQSGK